MDARVVHNSKVPINQTLLQSSMPAIRAAPRVMGVIAGWDPSGGAGMLADVATAQALQVRTLGLVSCLTAQSLQHWAHVQATDSALLEAQMRCLQRDPLPPVWKVGALGSAANSQALAQWLGAQRPKPTVVLDPILHSSSAGQLGMAAWLQPWLPLKPLLCPNSAEWEHIGTQLPAASQCPRLITDAPHGARLYSPDDAAIEFEYTRRPGEWRGTGCTLATLIAIALSAELPTAQACGFGLAQLQSWLAQSAPPHIQRRPEAM